MKARGAGLNLGKKGSEDVLGRLVAEGESATVEFKESFDDEAIETVAAFANAEGGTLLVGVADDGSVRGLTLGKETLREWANRIGQATRVHPKFNRLTRRGKAVVAVHVPESTIKPVPCRGRYFKRVGNSNRQVTDDDLTRAVLDRVGMTWDQVPEPRASLDDIDPARLQRFRTLCSRVGRRPIPESEDDLAVLERLHLARDGQLLRAAVLLFGRDPQRFYPSAFVKIGRFRSPTLIVDDREVYGTLFDQVEGAMLYFREHLQTRFEFTGEPARKVIWEYPLEALREAISNAVCHRDYLESAHIQVRWYDDRLTFFNPGGLPPPLRLEELKLEHPSIPRNRLIAEMFFYVGWIERWGRGIQKIMAECAVAGIDEPAFEERSGGLWLTFRASVLGEEPLRLLGLNERQVKALLWVETHGIITNRAYREMNAVSNKAAYVELGDLVRCGLLARVGAGRATHYTLPKGGGR